MCNVHFNVILGLGEGEFQLLLLSYVGYMQPYVFEPLLF